MALYEPSKKIFALNNNKNTIYKIFERLGGAETYYTLDGYYVFTFKNGQEIKIPICEAYI